MTGFLFDMNKFTKITIGLGATSFVILIAIVIFLYHLVTKSFPVTKGEVALPALQAKVEIYRDDYGVPHISARNEHDLMFAVGYVHAQDRLWQMDLTRRAGQGRLSEIFDTATVKFDKLLRTLGFSIIAESLYKYSHPTSRRLLNDYTQGVNTFIFTNKGKYPVEFDILNYEPEPWKPQHTLLVSRLLAWELNFAWWVDLMYGEIAKNIPPEKFQQIFLSSSESRSSSKAMLHKPFAVNDVRDYLKTVRSYREFFNKGPFASGSNAWVINSSKSLSGKPILATDPHLIVSTPAKWYEAHLTAPGWNVAGVTIPGAPLVVIGHNDSIAWGFTNAMVDDTDFFIERTGLTETDTYLFRNTILPIQTREEVIYIGSSDSTVIKVLTTHHGPIITDVHPTIEHKTGLVDTFQTISMRWTGFDISDEILCFYRLNRAQNAFEFEEGLKQLTVPGQNVVYADVSGNIGYWLAGRIPVRGNHIGTLPLNGWDGNDEWKGYISFDKLPKEWNPIDGFIISANQKIENISIQYYISTLWESGSRYNRIRDLLSLEKLSSNDFQQFQQDVVSYYCMDLTKQVLNVINSDSTQDPKINAALVYLRNWNFRCTPSDIASTIINKYFVRLIHNLYRDELGEELLDNFIYPLNVIYRVTNELLKKDNSSWFDDVGTDTIETKDMIIRKSFHEAVDELQSTFGGEMKTWQWGIIHQVIFEHPLGVGKPLDKVFNVGPFPIGGSEQTVCKGAFNLTKPFRLFAAPSARQIVDLSHPKTAYNVLTLGQSGQPMNKHYDDQVLLWLNGGYRTVTIDWNEIKKQKWDHLVLKPE